MPRVIADVRLLERYARTVEGLAPRRRRAVDRAEQALEDFFTSRSAFGPTSTPILHSVRGVLADTSMDSLGVEATAVAFREAEVVMALDPQAGWRPDDRWVEDRRRRWITEFHPWAAGAAAPAMPSAVMLRRLAEVEDQLAAARSDGRVSPIAFEQLLATRNGLRREALVHIDALGDAVASWTGTDNDPVLDGLVATRAAMVALLASDGWTARRMTGLLDNDGAPRAAEAFDIALREGAVEARLREVMDARGLDRDGARDVIVAMDAEIAGLLAIGVGPREAVVAFAMAEQLGLELGLAIEVAERSGIGIVDAVGRLAAAQVMDLDVDQVADFDAFRSHFDAFDAARRGSTDGRVSVADLEHVVAHPADFLPGQVLAARAILAEPRLRNRLDTAAANGDILDGEVFGASDPGDGVISRDDIDAFLLKTSLAHTLAEVRLDLDTAARGGSPDGFFSDDDLTAWLDANPGAAVEVRNAVQSMLDAGLVDHAWLEANREALAMGAAVVAGGVVIVVSGGTGTPLAVAGFAAGAGAAGATTIAVNHLTGEALFDDTFANALEGGMIAMSVAGLPAVWSGVRSAAAAGSITIEGVGATATFAAETSGIVGSGGVDLLLPDHWEDEVHDVASRIESSAGMVAEGAGIAEGLLTPPDD